MGVASGVEGVEQILNVAERDGRRDVHVDAEPDLDGRKPQPDDLGDERRGRGQVVGEQAVRIHVMQLFRHKIGQLFRHRNVAVAVGVEDRVQLDLVSPGPVQIGDDLSPAFRRPIVHWP